MMYEPEIPRRPKSVLALRRFAACCAVVLVAAAPALAEDRITAKGDTLRGQLVELDAAGVVFAPIQGEGTIRVPWEDVESLETEGAFTVLYGDRGEARGRVLGVDAEGLLLIGEDAATAQQLETDELFAGYAQDGGLTLAQRLRSRFRYWTASLDAGAAYTDATTDTTTAFVGLFLDRRRAPTYLLIEGQARYGTQKEASEDRSLTESLAWGLVRGEYDLTERFFSYASTRATYDATQHLSLRLEPRGGLGMHVVKGTAFNLSTDLGAAWVYEDYFGDEPVFPGQPLPERARGRDDYWAVAFGAQADAKLPFGTLWRARAEYLPAVDDWANNYLIRGETSLDFPLLAWVAFRLALADEYDNTPAPGSQRNRFTSTAGLSFRFP